MHNSRQAVGVVHGGSCSARLRAGASGGSLGPQAVSRDEFATVATPYVLRTVGTFSMQATLLFSTLVWGTSLLGSIVSFLLIDRIGRKSLCYLSLIPAGCMALLMGTTAGSDPTMLVIGYFAFSFFLWLGSGAYFCNGVGRANFFRHGFVDAARGFATACAGWRSPSTFFWCQSLASIGFGPFIALCRGPSAHSPIVNRIDIFESAGVSLEELE